MYKYTEPDGDGRRQTEAGPRVDIWADVVSDRDIAMQA